MSTRPGPIAVGGDPNLNRTSAHGGAVLWLEWLRRTGVLRDLSVPVAGRQGWTDGQMLLAVALLNGVGYERVSDVGARAHLSVGQRPA